MKSVRLLGFLAICLWAATYWLPVQPGLAQGAPGGRRGLCLPGALPLPGDCLALGPAAYRARLAELGMSLPLPPIPAMLVDPAYAEVNVRYGLVRSSNAPVFASLEDAMSANRKAASQFIQGEFTYISYTDEAVVNGKRYYMIDALSWMTANDVSRIGALPRFQGLVLNRTPRTPFGWVLSYFSAEPVKTKRTPGYHSQDYTGHTLQLHEVVWVFGEQSVDGESWYMVGPDEWVPARLVARVLPNITPPEGVSGERWIEVNLFEQTLAVYDQRRLVFATLIASGAEPFWTRPGTFQIREKLEATVMRGGFDASGAGGYYLEDVPWTMYFDGARALHGAYWRAKLGYPQSHGCINLSVGDAHWLFEWANLGDWVYVWDPSGKTPTDPNLYPDWGY